MSMQRTKKKRRSQRSAVLGLMPLYLWTLAFVLLPTLYVLYLSFMTKGETWGVINEFTLSNFARIADPLYLGIFADSLRVALITTALALIMAYPFAYFMARVQRRRRNLLLLLVIVPFWTSALVRTYGWVILLRNNGVVNQLLMALRITDEPLRMLYTEGAVLAGMVYSLLPFMILPIYSSIEKFDWSVLEASRDLGAGRAYSMASVVVPLTMPGIVSGCVLVFIPALGLFFISDLLGGAKHMLLGNLIHNQLTTARDWPFGAALSVVMIGLTMCLLALYRRATGGSVEVM